MTRYIYAYNLVQEDDGEIFLKFRKFPQIISNIMADEFQRMQSSAIQVHAEDAILVTLQGLINHRKPIPECDDINICVADGFVILGPQIAMKLELYKLYLENSRSMLDFSRVLGTQETAARRLLDLRHQSRDSAIDAALAVFGKKLIHDWNIEPAPALPAKSVLKLPEASPAL